jgi:hypothetical protein
MPSWMKDLYYLTLKEDRLIQDLFVFSMPHYIQIIEKEAFANWSGEMLEVQKFLDSLK